MSEGFVGIQLVIKACLGHETALNPSLNLRSLRLQRLRHAMMVLGFASAAAPDVSTGVLPNLILRRPDVRRTRDLQRSNLVSAVDVLIPKMLESTNRVTLALLVGRRKNVVTALLVSPA